MIDLVKLKLCAGDGGDGRISLLREKSRPKGGPDGGDGGRGGSIVVVADKNINTLKHFAGIKEIVAKKGENGGKNKMHGADADDITIRVPLGTVIWLEAENNSSNSRRRKYEQSLADFEFDQEFDNEELDKKEELANQDQKNNQNNEVSLFRFDVLFHRNDVRFQKFFQDYSGSRIGMRDYEIDEIRPVLFEAEQAEVKHFNNLDKILDSSSHEAKTIKIAELKQDGESIVLCQGGLGGRGNRAFRSSINQTPREAEYGTFGEKKEVVLELRLLADLGLVGLPNAGKSTLLSRFTKARPKIANYPFTTIEPNLGIMSSSDDKKDLVIADIPGLIEGASQGKGLGDRFLRHIENCQMLMYVLYLEEEVVFDEMIDLKEKAEKLYQQYQLLQNELEAYQSELPKKLSIVTINKADIYPKEFQDYFVDFFADRGIEVMLFSGVTGEGLEIIKDKIFSLKD